MSDPLPDLPLDHVIDDLSTKEQCADWVAAELLKGRAAEALTDELVANGWGGEDAEELVEHVRRATRAVRGVVTREDVVRDANQRHRRATGGWFVGLPSFAAAYRLLNAIVTLKAFHRIKRTAEREIDPPDDQPK